MDSILAVEYENLTESSEHGVIVVLNGKWKLDSHGCGSSKDIQGC